MVKINISIEGEDLSEIINELFNVGIEIIKSNKKEFREAMRIFADSAFDVLMEHNTLERGADLYRKINSEINWSYKRDKR